VGNNVNPAGALLASPLNQSYDSPANNALGAMKAGSITNVGGSQPHTNMQPYLVLTFCIALQGIFPSQT
jgi:microcystin-dependent protein